MITDMIQALYEPSKPLPADSAFYRRALEDIESSEVCSQIYWLLKRKGWLEQTPPFFRERLEQQFTKDLYLNIFVKSELERIVGKLEEAGIAAIPLKGVFFAEKYFGHIGARKTTDIDLLIRPEDMEKASACVKSLGFTDEEERIPAHFHASYSKPLPHSPIPLTVELHWDLLKAGTSSLRIGEFWHQAKPLGPYRHIKELSDYHTFYMICLHGWKHNLDSFKYILDIIQMICALRDNGELDYSLLFQDAGSHHTFKRMIWTLEVVYHILPQLEQIAPLPFRAKAGLRWDYHAVTDRDYNKRRQYINLIRSQFVIYDKAAHCLRAIWSWILPNKVELGHELGFKTAEGPVWVKYVMLYHKRCRRFIRVLFP